MPDTILPARLIRALGFYHLMNQKYISLSMIREDLDGIPHHTAVVCAVISGYWQPYGDQCPAPDQQALNVCITTFKGVQPELSLCDDVGEQKHAGIRYCEAGRQANLVDQCQQAQ